jgi:hypothetical protein
VSGIKRNATASLSRGVDRVVKLREVDRLVGAGRPAAVPGLTHEMPEHVRQILKPSAIAEDQHLRYGVPP